MRKEVELMALYWTISGIMPGRGEISRFDFRSRVESAAAAGFRGIGLWHTDLEHVQQTMSLSEMKRLLDDNGIQHLELEFLTDWFLEGGRKNESDNRRRRLLEAAAVLGAHHVKVGDFYGSRCSLERFAEAFGELCREAERSGTRVGYEIMKVAGLNNLEDALTMIRGAHAQNGGLILDIVHMVMMGISFERIARVPRDFLVSIELNDGTRPGSPREDPARDRRYCGEGEFDIKGFVSCLLGIGYEGPWGVEVYSGELAGLSLGELCARAFQTTLSQFETG